MTADETSLSRSPVRHGRRVSRVGTTVKSPLPVIASVFLAALLALQAEGALGQEKSYEIGSYEVDVAVQGDGSYRVAERISLRFTGGEFSRVHRDIPLSRVDSLAAVEVSSQDVAVRGSSVESDGGRARIRWEFAPVRGEVDFVLRYRVHGAIQEEDGRNVVHWAAVGDAWEVPIDSVRVAVSLPAAFVETPDSLAVAPASDARISDTGEGWSVTFSNGGLEPSTTYAVRIAFPLAVAGRPAGDRAGRIFLFAAVAAVVGMLPGIYLSWRWTGPDPSVEPARSGRSTPDLPLALAATLLRVESVERSGDRLFAALLTDLARRGHLRLERYEEDALIGSRERVRARVLHGADGQGADPDAPEDEVVAGVEKELLKRLARHESLAEFREEEGEFRERVRERLSARLEERGLVENRTGRSRKTKKLALVGFVAAAVAAAGGAALGSAPLWELAGLLAGLALGGVFAATRKRQVTAQGGRVRARVRAFIEGRKEEIEAAVPEGGARRREAARRLVADLPWLILEPGFPVRVASELDEELGQEGGELLRPEWIRDLTGEEDAAWTAAHAAGAAAASASSAAASGAAGAGAAGAAGGGGGGAA